MDSVRMIRSEKRVRSSRKPQISTEVPEGVEKDLRKTWACLGPNASCLGKERIKETEVVARTAKLILRGNSAYDNRRVRRTANGRHVTGPNPNWVQEEINFVGNEQ